MFKVNKETLEQGVKQLPGAFSDKVTPDIDFTDEAVVQFDAPVVRILL